MCLGQTGPGSAPSPTRSVGKILKTIPTRLPDPNQHADTEAFIVEIHEQLESDRVEAPRVFGKNTPMVHG